MKHDRIYVIAQQPEQAKALLEMLVLRGFDEAQVVDPNEAQEKIAKKPPTLIILDAEGCHQSSLSFLQSLPVSTSVIFLSETFDEETLLQSFDTGAKDFLVKPVNPTYLMTRVLLVLQQQRLKEQLDRQEAILAEFNVLSKITGLFSQGYMHKILTGQTQAYPLTYPTGILMVQSNQPGTDEMEFVSQGPYLAECLKNVCRGQDIPGEWGVGQFLILLPQTTQAGVDVVSQRLREKLQSLSTSLHNKVVFSLKASLAESKEVIGTRVIELANALQSASVV